MAIPEPPQISSKLLSSLFARFTADRDALFAAVERCEQRLVELSEQLGTPGAGDPVETKADQALAVAQEALELARGAMKAVRQRRG
jgi:hypothetical protein